MDTALKDYIRTMFAMPTTPDWDAGYDGTIFYDQAAHKWVTGDNVGWQIIDRGTTYLANEIFSLLWIDSFEYPNDSIIRNNYTTSTSGLQLYSENNLTTYGDYALKCVATISGSKDEYISKLLDPMVSLKDMDTINFDIRSNRVGTNLQYSLSTMHGWLGDWAQRRKITVDTTYIDTDLTHFPIAVVLGTSVGQDDDDVSDIFDELTCDTDDDFTGEDGDAPNTDLWGISGEADHNEIINNNYQIKDTAISSGKLTSKFKITGDFSIQIDIDGFFPSITQMSAGINLKFDNGDSLMFKRRYYDSGTPHQIMSNQFFGGSWGTEQQYNTAVTSLKLKITRIGTTINYYRDTTGIFILHNTITGPNVGFYLEVTGEHTSAVSYEINFDNFKVNSGTIIWPEGHPNRKKIAITKDDGATQLYGEIEQWDSANEKATIWVSKEDLVLSSTENTELYLYYDVTQDDNTKYISDTSELVDFSDTITGDNFTNTTTTQDVDDDFTGSNGEAPNSALWEVSGPEVTINNNKLQSSSSTSTFCSASFHISGDFDIQSDWDSTFATTDPVFLALRVTFLNSDRFQISRRYDSNIYAAHSYESGWTQRGSSVGTSDSSGKFRLTRVGTTMSAYYWNGSTWVLPSGATYIMATEVAIVSFNYDASVEVTANFDNFKVNSGTVKWFDTPNPYLWDSTGEVKLYNDKIKLSTNDSTSRAVARYKIDGDFDVQIDFDVSEASFQNNFELKSIYSKIRMKIIRSELKDLQIPD